MTLILIYGFDEKRKHQKVICSTDVIPVASFFQEPLLRDDLDKFAVQSLLPEYHTKILYCIPGDKI